MFQELKLVFQTHARVERYETSNKYFAYKMEENSSTSEHVLRLSEYYNRLNQVGVNLPDKIVIDRILQSPSPKLVELRDELQYARDDESNSRALRDAEIDEGRNQEKHQVLMVDETTSFKKGQREEGELQ